MCFFFFFKQKTAYEMRISDWSSDVCSSDLLLGSGCILREVIAAADLLKEEWGVTSDVWSVPSFTELARDGREVERWNLLHPTQTAKRSYVEECLGGMTGDRKSVV